MAKTERIKKIINNSFDDFTSSDKDYLIYEINQLNKTIQTLIDDAKEQDINLDVPNGKEHIRNPY